MESRNVQKNQKEINAVLSRKSAFSYLKFNLIGILNFIIYSLFYYLKVLKNVFISKTPKSIKKQIALVTGGGSGFGRALSFELADHGCIIAVADVNLASAEETAKEIQKRGLKAKAYKVDVSNFAEVEAIVAGIELDLGPIDILVNNAGLMPAIPLEEMSIDYIEKTIRVNLLAHFWTIKVTLDGMIKRKRGHIVAISSLAGLISPPIGTVYTATKFGVTGLMESLTMDLLLKRCSFINTTTVHPYFMSTNYDLNSYLEETNTLKNMPALSCTYVAKQVVEGIIYNHRRILIPSWFRILVFLMNVLPQEMCEYAKLLPFKNTFLPEKN